MWLEGHLHPPAMAKARTTWRQQGCSRRTQQQEPGALLCAFDMHEALYITDNEVAERIGGLVVAVLFAATDGCCRCRISAQEDAPGDQKLLQYSL
jgi:hypothetical protein